MKFMNLGTAIDTLVSQPVDDEQAHTNVCWWFVFKSTFIYRYYGSGQENQCVRFDSLAPNVHTQYD